MMRSHQRAASCLAGLLLATATPVAAHPKGADTLADVGGSIITTQDLRRRLETMPFPDQQSTIAPETLKVRTLLSMVAEKLLARESGRQGLTWDRSAEITRRELENLFIRDELFRREVAAKSEPTEEEITRGMNRIRHEYVVLAFLAPSQDDAAALVSVLSKAPPESVLARVPRSLYQEADTVAVTFGAPDTNIENALWAPRTNRVTQPVLTRGFGWAVMYVLDRRTNPDAASLSLEDRRRQVTRIVRDRKEAQRVEVYYYTVLQSRHARADSGVFVVLAEALEALWREDTLRYRSNGKYILTSDMVEVIMSRLQPHLESVLVRIDDGDLTLGEVLEKFKYEDFLADEREGLAFRRALNEEVRSLVARELLAREGRRLGLQYTEAVRGDLQVWADYLSAAVLWHKIRDSVRVGDREIMAFLVNHADVLGRTFEVNVREVLCASSEDAALVADRLGGGMSLEEAARQYSRRAAWAARGGESGYFLVAEHPEIGFEALNADSGVLVGPVKSPDGFSLFTTLGTRRTRETAADFETLKDNVRGRLTDEMKKQALDRAVAGLARQERPVINYDRLREVNITNIPMFTRRLIGFGGRMNAAPLLMRQWDWVKEYQQPPEVMP